MTLNLQCPVTGRTCWALSCWKGCVLKLDVFDLVRQNCGLEIADGVVHHVVDKTADRLFVT